MSIKVECTTRHEVSATPAEIAAVVANMDDTEQGEFFNTLGEEIMSWPNAARDNQLYYITHQLTPKGKMVILALANWITFVGAGEKRDLDKYQRCPTCGRIFL